MKHDPVDVDLNRHLARVEEDEAREERIDEILEEWLTEKERISEAIADELNLEQDLHDILVREFIGNNPDRFGLAIIDTLTEKFEEDDDATDEYVERCLKTADLVSEELRDELALPYELHRIAVTAVLSDDWRRFFGWIEDFLREHFRKDSEKEYEREIERDEQDAAEARASAREDFGE